MIVVGSKVHLKGAAFGQPGLVIRVQPRRVTIHWVDLDYIGHHSMASLIEAEPQS